MDNALVESVLTALGSTYGRKAAEISVEQIKGWFAKATQSVEASVDFDISNIEELTAQAFKQGSPMLDAEITRKNLARWFEVPHEEFVMTPAEQLEPEVLIRHLFLEKMFEGWLKEWRYDVSVGEDFEGDEGIEFTPDVYGKLDTLHGEFEIFVNFVCDNPPSQYRVRALLETLESYATDKSDFKWGDIYILERNPISLDHSRRLRSSWRTRLARRC